MDWTKKIEAVLKEHPASTANEIADRIPDASVDLVRTYLNRMRKRGDVTRILRGREAGGNAWRLK